MVEQLSIDPWSDLSSPAKQIRLLLGIMLEEKELPTSTEFSRQDWDKIIEPLEELSHAYLQLYVPTTDQVADKPKEWDKTHQVAMTTFLSYHQNGMMASVEQISDQIRLYLCPLDKQLSRDLGISASNALTIAHYIGQEIQTQMDLVVQYVGDKPSTPELHMELAHALERLGKVRLSDVTKRFGDEGESFWNLFAVCRGEGPLINYPTERSVVETKPLILTSNDEAMLFSYNALLSGILLKGEEALIESSISERYLRHRDKTLEKQVAATFRRILGKHSKSHRNVYEELGRQYEHDLVTFTDNVCLFVESKASSMDEPFRDPEKSFTRIRRSFRSQSGIQKAYNQSLRIYNKLRDEGLVLFDKNGELSPQIPKFKEDDAFCVCVTRDNFGPIATFLSPLLSKEDGDPYPWVVNILVLEQIADTWECFGWDGRQLKALLSQRILLHENVFSDDELDYIAAYICHCGLHHLAKNKRMFFQLDPKYALIFDQIYRHKYHGEPQKTIYLTRPAISALQEFSLTDRRASVTNVPQEPIMVGRNELCPCGSTVKFKRCHGRLEKGRKA